MRLIGYVGPAEPIEFEDTQLVSLAELLEWKKLSGWILHTALPEASLAVLQPLLENTRARGLRWPAASGDRVEFVLVSACRSPGRPRAVSGNLLEPAPPEWIEAVAKKPRALLHWSFEAVAARPGDYVADVFWTMPALAPAWQAWCERRAH